MPNFRIKLRDTVTIARQVSCVVDVPSRACAEGTALWMSHSGVNPTQIVSGQNAGDQFEFTEERVGRTPFQIEIEEA